MKRTVIASIGLALLVLLQVVMCVPLEAGTTASPPQSRAYGKTLSEWMRLYFTWFTSGAVGADHVGHVRFLNLPAPVPVSGTGVYADPATLQGHLDIALRPGTPFVLPVVSWVGETYDPALGYDDDPVLPAEIFTDASQVTIKVSIDGKPVMDSTSTSVGPFYFGPVPLDVTYATPTFYGAVGAIFVQGIGFVHSPLSVGTHTIELDSELLIPPDPALLNPNLYPEGVGIRFLNSWTITVSPRP